MLARRSLFSLLAVASLAAAAPAAPAAAQPSDTTRVSRTPLFTVRDAYLAAGFVGATILFNRADQHFATRLQDSSTQTNRFFRNTAADFRFMGNPGSFLIGTGLYAVGRLTHHERPADLGLHGLEALFLGEAITNVVKGTAGRARPYIAGDTNPHDFKLLRGFRKGRGYVSFPSGHTTAAFAAASTVTAETSKWWPGSWKYIGPVMYGGATMVGLSRMFNNQHWASDVAMGAAVGTFAGLKVVRYNHSHPSNRIDRIFLKTAVIPDGTGGALVMLSLPAP